MKNHMQPAKYLSLSTTPQLKLHVLICSMLMLLMMHNNGQAEQLKDPTQPPVSLSNETATGNSHAITGPVLQSVMIGAEYLAAIISGHKVMLGSKYEQATLIKVNEHEAVLRNPDMTTQILAMDYAGVKKMVHTDIAPKSSPKFVKEKKLNHLQKLNKNEY